MVTDDAARQLLSCPLALPKNIQAQPVFRAPLHLSNSTTSLPSSRCIVLDGRAHRCSACPYLFLGCPASEHRSSVFSVNRQKSQPIRSHTHWHSHCSTLAPFALQSLLVIPSFAGISSINNCLQPSYLAHTPCLGLSAAVSTRYDDLKTIRASPSIRPINTALQKTLFPRPASLPRTPALVVDINTRST